MDDRQKQGLAGILKVGIRFGCSMKAYTTFRIGGPAEALCRVRDIRELPGLVTYLKSENIPCLVVGKGSNLLVRDGGIPGVVIFLEGRLAEVRECGKSDQVLLAGGGATLADLLNTCKEKGLSGLEFLAGIPGTVGGAVVMNAGAFGGEIGDRVQKLRIITGEGDTVEMDRSEIRFSYRKSSIPEGAIVIEVAFQLERSEPAIVRENMGDCLKRRKKGQPLEFPSCGSVFKNPPGDYAGRLIEKAGLKGKRIGGALISPKHANYIVNTGDAGAEDVLALMALARERVRRETGIELEPEIQVVGRRI